MTITFEDFGLSEALNTSLRKMDYKDPTPIQQQAIPLALKGKDVLGSAQTGTGKTAAFSIPLVEHIISSHTNNCALILTPTRELAKQVLDVIHQLLGPKSGINTAFIIGGEQYYKQFQQLERNPRIIVGTPGRINDHLERGSIDLGTTDFLVLDETDRMLDMGFGIQLGQIVEHLPAKHQTLMFSATLPKGIITIADRYLKKPERVSVGDTNVVAPKIKQEVLRIEQGDKYRELLIQLNERQGTVIVFVKTKYNADKMAQKLREDGITAQGLHGDLRQHKRDKVMKQYRDKVFRVLVATDIAARGLDVPHIEHVINYDLPQVAEDYIHRMGRTARAGAEGSAISFVSSPEGRKWHAIEMLLDPEAAAARRAPPTGKHKARKKPYRGRPTKGEPKNDNSAPNPKKKRKEKYIAKADRPHREEREGGEKSFDKRRDNKRRDDKRGQGKPAHFKRSQEEQSNEKPHFKKKKEYDPNAPENKFVAERKAKKSKKDIKGVKKKKKVRGPKKKVGKGKPATNDGSAPMKKRHKKKKAPQR
jgi:superfamily II DNA/RNA helicase